MEIEFQNTEPDYKDFFIRRKNRNFLKQITPVLVIAILTMIIPSGKEGNWLDLLTGVSVSVIIIALLIYFIPLGITIIRFNLLSSVDKSLLFSKKKVITLNEGLSINVGDRPDIIGYERINSVQLISKFVYLKFTGRKILLIPKKAFVSDADVNNFQVTVKNGILRTTNKINQLNGSYYKPPYALGFLGLIPLVGAFVGIGLALYGIFKYKDKKLIFIGLADILFTVIVYSSLIISSDSDAHKEAFLPFAQTQLNTLSKDIEFYKVQYGNYPDSLEQLTAENPNVWIIDPLKGVGNKNNHFKYKKEPNGYYLFSAGLDGVADTKDDIFPVVPKMATTKSGLILKSHN